MYAALGQYRTISILGMGTITALEPQRRSGRVNVYVDGQFAMGLHTSVVEDQALRIGLEITTEELQKVSQDEERRRAVANAVRMLESRSRSKHEIEVRLTERGYTIEIIDVVLAQLTRAGLVDDPAFAKEWVGSRSRAKEPVGPIRLRHEMKLKGINPKLAEEVLGDLNKDDELAQAMRAAQRHTKPYASYAGWMSEKKRVAGYLQRRGYGWEVINAVLREVVGNYSEEQPSDDYDPDLS